ncbi:MAG TPA: EpsI family protein [Longimicrobiales bacterium]|nr:EpsI family protein [Longimicrobiales bacterium]
MTLRMMWLPAILLSVGAAASTGAGVQRSMPLRAPLADVIPRELDGLRGVDQEVSLQEQRVAGMDEYLLRRYSSEAAATATMFSVYVGYYEKQMRGHTIHSPKNCLPGAGWEALTSSTAVVQTASGAVPVTKYLLKRKDERAVVLYWYQGRGRVEANEYRVKWNLLRDAAVRRRSDEALVRVVVPVTSTEAEATQVASRVAVNLIPALTKALP